MIALCLLIGQVTADHCVMKKLVHTSRLVIGYTPIHHSRHRIRPADYADRRFNI